MDVKELLKQAVLEGASDIFIIAGLPVSYRLDGSIIQKGKEKLMPYLKFVVNKIVLIRKKKNMQIT